MGGRHYDRAPGTPPLLGAPAGLVAVPSGYLLASWKTAAGPTVTGSVAAEQLVAIGGVGDYDGAYFLLHRSGGLVDGVAWRRVALLLFVVSGR